MSSPVVVLCSASATGLSRAATQLARLSDFEVTDLEEHLVERYREQYRFGTDHSMFDICSRLSRDSVLSLWEAAFDSCTQSLVSSAAKARVLACHMTLFSGRRLEFYTPPAIGRLTGLADHSLTVSRVIVLIDDIYDMYERLSTPNGLYDRERIRQDHIVHAWKLLTGGAEPEAFTDSERQVVETELHVRNLLRLLAWRRSEMVAAEELARTLGAPLAVLATKHEFDSLATLCRWPGTKTAYISHKITEPRVANILSTAVDERERWDPLVFEVNALSEALRHAYVAQEHVPDDSSVGLIAIQPTAIDELRYLRAKDVEANVATLTGELSDRWPVPDSAIYNPPSGEAPNYIDFLLRGGAASEVERGLVSLLAQSIYDEISFRDHLLVSCNQALLVYRPTAMGLRVSGGVRQEILHWTSGPLKPAAVVHTSGELVAFMRMVADNPTLASRLSRTARQTFELALRERDNVPEDAAEWLWDRQIAKDEPEARLPSNLLTDHLGRSVASTDQVAAVERASRHACVAGIALLFGVSPTGIDRVAHFIARDGVEASSSHFLMRVCAFLVSSGQAIVRGSAILNDEAVAIICREFGLPSARALLSLLVARRES